MKAKKPVGLFVTLGVLAAAAFGGYKYYTKPAKLTFVKAAITSGSMESVISATGTLTATRSVAVGSRVSGNVVRMYADYNTVVRRGDLLAEIDPSTFQNTMEQRQAALASANTQRLSAQVAEKRADVDVSNARLNIASQKAALNRAESQRNEAKRKYDQQVNLAKEGIVSQDVVATAKATYDQAELSVATAEAALMTAEAQLESTIAQREVQLTQKTQAESQIKQAEGSLQDAQLQLSFTRIEAPVDGVVIARNMNEGQTVQASTTAPQLYEIAEDLRSMHLETNIDESDISRVQLGQETSFTVDAFPGQTFRGEVIQVRRAAVNVQNVVSYTVVVSVDNSDLRLFPGMTANTRIIVDRAANALRIPSAALRFRPPDEITVTGDVGGKGKGGFGKGGFGKGEEAKEPETKQTSEAKSAPTRTVAQVDGGENNRRSRAENVDANNGSAPSGENGGFRRRNGGEGDGKGFDPSQFKGRDGKGFDPSQFKGRDGKGFDPSQFKGRGGNRNGGTNATGGNQFAGFGRGGAGAVTRPTFQTVYRTTGKEYEVEALRVRTGISDGNWVQLLPGSPLNEGDELVTAVDGLPVTSNQNKGNNFPGGGFPGGNNNFKGKGGFGF